MGIPLFSSSSADKSFSGLGIAGNFSSSKIKGKAGRVIVVETNTLPNPRPDNYKILRDRAIGNCLIVKIHYLDCKNYEGQKILVFEDCTIHALLKQKLIDPHFSENKKFFSPVARFEPTERGWNHAVRYAEYILKK